MATAETRAGGHTTSRDGEKGTPSCRRCCRRHSRRIGRTRRRPRRGSCARRNCMAACLWRTRASRSWSPPFPGGDRKAPETKADAARPAQGAIKKAGHSHFKTLALNKVMERGERGENAAETTFCSICLGSAEDLQQGETPRGKRGESELRKVSLSRTFMPPG